jgi:hypothetical protein
MNPNFWRKALLAGLAAGAAYAQASQPTTTADWTQVGAAALGAALLTYYVPNADKKEKVNADAVPPSG